MGSLDGLALRPRSGSVALVNTAAIDELGAVVNLDQLETAVATEAADDQRAADALARKPKGTRKVAKMPHINAPLKHMPEPMLRKAAKMRADALNETLAKLARKTEQWARQKAAREASEVSRRELEHELAQAEATAREAVDTLMTLHERVECAAPRPPAYAYPYHTLLPHTLSRHALPPTPRTPTTHPLTPRPPIPRLSRESMSRHSIHRGPFPSAHTPPACMLYMLCMSADTCLPHHARLCAHPRPVRIETRLHRVFDEAAQILEMAGLSGIPFRWACNVVNENISPKSMFARFEDNAQ
jgi:hypothetical protein